MPPKIKISKDDILKTTLALTRERGADALNARAIAAELGCSTQPIFSNFASMDELQAQTASCAYDIYLGFLEKEVKSGKYHPYKAYGMAYVRFAREERELFKLLFMSSRDNAPLKSTQDFDASVDMIMQKNGITRELASLIHFEMWTCVHGIGTMLATSFLSLDEDTISNMISDVYQGILKIHSEGKN